eukprot:2364472-Rhodomonas_salina.1
MELADDARLIRCSFDQTIRHDYRHKKVRHVSTLEVVEAMVHNRSTLTIPDVSLYWPESVGSVKLRVKGFKRFPSKNIGLQHAYYGFMTSIVDSEMPDKRGMQIDTGLRALGPKGILHSLKDISFEDACWREEEWVPTW